MKQRNLARELIEIYTQESDCEGKPFGKYRLMFMIWPSINTTQLGMVAHLCNLATGELVLWIVGGLGSLGGAGYVEPASALSLASTWAPCGSTG